MLRWLTEQVLPAVAASGRLGDNVEFLRCEEDQSVSSEAQFASSVSFVTAEFRSKGGRCFRQPLVIKYNIPVQAVRLWLKSDQQFQNEVIAYEKVLPFLGKFSKITEIFPKYFYGSTDPKGDPSEYVVVIENLTKQGFKLSSQVLDLDYDHCVLVFKKLGAYHASSYKAKHFKPEGFRELVNSLVEVRVFEEKKEEWWYSHVKGLDRASKPLLEKGEKVEEIKSFKEKLDRDVFTYKKNVLTVVKEQIGVICHGDFCRNNILYKYEQGKPVDAIFFDLATARYGSPMLDFCFFFFFELLR